MISIKQFHEIYPDSNAFRKDFPPGYSFKWCDRKTKYHIVDYAVDQSTGTDLIILKAYNRNRRNWYYECMDTYVFYSTWEILNREGIIKSKSL